MGRDYHEKRRRRSKRKFVQIWHDVVASPAYHSLSVYARAALIEICDRYHGTNNGKVPFSVREMAKRLRTGPRQASRALMDLVDRGVIAPERTGWFSPNHCHATEWRITFQATDRPATNDYRNWNPEHPMNSLQKQFPVSSGDAPGIPTGHTSGSAKMNDSIPTGHISGERAVSPQDTHIDSSQYPISLRAALPADDCMAMAAMTELPLSVSHWRQIVSPSMASPLLVGSVASQFGPH
jgi:hypothetical protein